MYKLFKSKRGIAIDDLIELVAAIIVFGLIIIALHINSTNQQKQMSINIRNELNNIKAEKDLLNFLKTAIKIEEKEIDMADLIVLWNREFTKAKPGEDITTYREEEKNTYTGLLNTEVEKFLSELKNDCVTLYPAHYDRALGGGHSLIPYIIASPRWGEKCGDNLYYQEVFVDLPSFNPTEGRELKASSIRVLLNYQALNKNQI